MKKNDWILLTAVALYSFLFYQQTAGLNFVLFTLALIFLLLAKDRTLLNQKMWWLAAIGSFLSACCIGVYGATLAVTANIISLALLSALSFAPRSSVILSLFFSFFTFVLSPGFMIMDGVARHERLLQEGEKKTPKKIGLLILPVLITLVFFFIYRASNSLFNELAKKINLDFISFSWILFTIGGIFLLYGFFYHRNIKKLADLDQNAPNTLEPTEKATIDVFGRALHVRDHEFSGRVLFILLNVLLLIVNTLDINFMFLGGGLPKGLTHSDFVHQGTGMLILSIVLAILIILFYFRGALNFYNKNKLIKFLAYLWILQNVVMIVSTALRNNLYVSEYGLTYKRIGVYIYLLLTVIGLVTTFIKIARLKSNSYLFRTNGWLFYAVLVLSCFLNWDLFITNYNITYPKSPQKEYLIRLSDTNLPQLYRLQPDTLTLLHMPINAYDRFHWDNDYTARLSRKLYAFLLSYQINDWRSWHYDQKRVYKELIVLNTQNGIRALDLSWTDLSSLAPLKDFGNIQELGLASNKLYNLNELPYFPNLKSLNLMNNKLVNINAVSTLQQLEYLNLVANPILDYSPLYGLKHLKELKVGPLITPQQCLILKAKLPQTMIIVERSLYAEPVKYN